MLIHFYARCVCVYIRSCADGRRKLVTRDCACNFPRDGSLSRTIGFRGIPAVRAHDGRAASRTMGFIRIDREQLDAVM